MKKAVISVFIVLTLVLNVFGFGVLSSRASAAAGVDDAIIIGFLASCIVGAAGGLASGYGESLDTYFSNHYGAYMQNIVDSINEGQIGELFNLYYSGNNSEFRPVDGISGDDLEFATFMCNYLNDHSSTAIDAYINSYAPDPALAWFGLDGVKRQISSSLYSQLKTDAVNAFTAYIEMKKRNLAISEGLEALEEATGEAWSAPYAFDFQRPISPIEMQQSVNRLDSINVEGIQFVAPAIIDYISPGGSIGGGYLSLAHCNARGFTNIIPHDNGYEGSYHVLSCYGGGEYILYNNDVYYYNNYAHKTEPYQNLNISMSRLLPSILSYYVSSSNVTLASLGISTSDLIGVYYGTYYWTEPGTNGIPLIEGLDNSSFTSTTPGDTINYDLTNDENTIGQALTLGLISDNPEITIDSEGNITAVDGIDLSVLENLVQELIDKTYDFSSFEEYLTTIVTLLQAANVNTDQIDDVLNALRAWEANQEDALDTINTSIASAAASITAALEISGEADLDLPDIDADGFLVTHTGLAEATTIVNSIPIVNQVSQLINNLLDSSQYDNSPPNFHFYYDSDGDGTDELYNAFDLSFLETDLSNNTLQDNELFDNSMTIRQFLQYLMIFLCYVAFAIRIIKKLPSLFGSAESFNEFTSEINK